MKNKTVIALIIRLVVYVLMMFGIAEGMLFDALHPLGDSYFGEITFTEITQEGILLILFVFFFWLGFRWKEIHLVAVIAALFFLVCFFREFNFLTPYWFIPAVIAILLILYVIYRGWRGLNHSLQVFFSQPASGWLFAGFLVTFVFSRLFGRAKFWLILYDENHYRLAKAVAEEGIELLGNTLMLIAAIEFFVAWLLLKREGEEV